MTIEQVALAITRLYAVLLLALGVSFLCFWLAARLIPEDLNAIAPFLGRYGAVSFQYGIVHVLGGGLLLVFGRRLARFMARP